MKEQINDFYVKVFLFILLPMILLIAFFYYEKNDAYINHVKNTETEMANILVTELPFIKEQIQRTPVKLNEKMEGQELNVAKIHSHGLQKIILEISKEGLDHGILGIYSLDQQKMLLQLGREDAKEYFDLEKIESEFNKMSNKEKKPFYIEQQDKLFYIVPIVEDGFLTGFIYSFHTDKQDETNPYLFGLIVLLAISIAFLGAKWVDLKTKMQINELKQELQTLQATGKSLTIRDNNLGEIAQSVNTINENLTNKYKMNKVIMDSIPLGIIYYGKDGIVQCVNETARRATGYSRDEIQQFTTSGNILGNSQHVFWETLRSGQKFLGYDSFCPTKHGKEIPVVTSTNQIFDEAGNLLGIVSSFIDISEQNRLQKVEQRSKIILDSISDGVITVNNEGIITSFNRGAEEMTGLKAEQVIDKSYDDLFIKKKSIFTKLTLTLRTGTEYLNHKRKIPKENGEIVHLMISTKLLWNEKGEQIGAVGIYKDITKNIELEEQIQRADKLAVIGELAAGTAHEIRNPLTTIQGFIQLLKFEAEGTHQKEYLEIVLKEITHINEIIKEMLLLAKPSAPQMEVASINQMVRDTVSFMNGEGLLHNVEIGMELDQDLPSIPLDERQIKQVFINLIRNSIQAMDHGGKIVLKTAYNEYQKTIIVSVIDNGIGISEEHLAKIYEPFYTTKEMGTGLGIPISCRIMQSHSGSLEIQSNTGKGTRVNLSFPIHRDDSF